jgi:hypothetical protein
MCGDNSHEVYQWREFCRNKKKRHRAHTWQLDNYVPTVEPFYKEIKSSEGRAEQNTKRVGMGGMCKGYGSSSPGGWIRQPSASAGALAIGIWQPSSNDPQKPGGGLARGELLPALRDAIRVG